MNEFSKELIESLTRACLHAEGKPASVRLTEHYAEKATPAQKARD